MKKPAIVHGMAVGSGLSRLTGSNRQSTPKASEAPADLRALWSGRCAPPFPRPARLPAAVIYGVSRPFRRGGRLNRWTCRWRVSRSAEVGPHAFPPRLALFAEFSHGALAAADYLPDFILREHGRFYSKTHP